MNDLRDDQEAADSPTWLGDTIAELKGRGFERVNDPNARHDQEAADAAAHARLRCNTTWFAGSDTASQRMNPAAAFAELRREFGDVFDAMPEPRTRLEPSQLRTVRQTDPRYPDTRTADERTTAELVRLVDAVQALRLEFDVLREELRAGRL